MVTARRKGLSSQPVGLHSHNGILLMLQLLEAGLQVRLVVSTMRRDLNNKASTGLHCYGECLKVSLVRALVSWNVQVQCSQDLHEALRELEAAAAVGSLSAGPLARSPGLYAQVGLLVHRPDAVGCAATRLRRAWRGLLYGIPAGEVVDVELVQPSAKRARMKP